MMKLIASLSTVLATVSSTLAQGSFNALTLNVAGLPELLSSGDPAVNTPLIGARLGPYSLINVQEDFNYHAALYAADSHPYRTPTSGGAGIGSGLNTLSAFPYIDLERVKWNDCNLNSGDCLTPKGFTAKRVRIADGVWVDVYNLHTDAGSDSGDISARSKNFAQLSSWIKTWSMGMPVLVMGDTNARYTRTGDSESLRAFISANGLTDTWISNIRGGSYPAAGSDALVCAWPFPAGTTQQQMVACEVVDKIFVRSGSTLTLSPTSYKNEHATFVNSTGYPLSDHYPISSQLSYTLSSSYRLGDTMGGPHGNPYHDVPAITTFSPSSVPKLTSITVRGGNRVDGIILTLTSSSGSTTTLNHGGTGGTASTLTLGSTERITQVQLCAGKYEDQTRVFYAAFTTNLGRSVTGGKTTGDCQTTTAPSGTGEGGRSWGLVGLWGRQGDEIDRAAPVWGAAF